MAESIITPRVTFSQLVELQTALHRIEAQSTLFAIPEGMAALDQLDPVQRGALLEQFAGSVKHARELADALTD